MQSIDEGTQDIGVRQVATTAMRGRQMGEALKTAGICVDASYPSMQKPHP